MTREGELPSSLSVKPNVALDVDLECPLCGYNLRGLIEPRCPECGYQFALEKLRDDKLRKHPYLFENHPERNVRSFFRTVWAGLLPGKFWRTLKPLHRFSPRRLFTYWLLVAMAPLLALAVEATNLSEFSIVIPRLFVDSSVERTAYAAVLPPGSPPPPMETRARGHRFGVVYFTPLLFITAFGLLWPWLTLLALVFFRKSTPGARVQYTHVVRCVVYSGDIVFWAGVIALAVTVAPFGMGDYFQADFTRLLAALLPIAWLIACYRLVMAYRLYLQSKHPIAMVAVSQVIPVLALVNAILILALDVF